MYAPCRNGIHVCGISADEQEFVTVANASGRAHVRFDDLRQRFGLPSVEDPDLVVDCMVDGDIVDDFGIRRQDLDALLTFFQLIKTQ